MTLTVVPELASSIKIADPRPDRCSACLCSAAVLGPDCRFIDFDSIIERGAVVDAGTMAVLDPIVKLFICEACMKAGLEQLGFKPELHARQLREIRRQETLIEHYRAAEERQRAENEELRAYIGRLEAAGARLREPAPRRRK